MYSLTPDGSLKPYTGDKLTFIRQWLIYQNVMTLLFGEKYPHLAASLGGLGTHS